MLLASVWHVLVASRTLICTCETVAGDVGESDWVGLSDAGSYRIRDKLPDSTVNSRVQLSMAGAEPGILEGRGGGGGLSSFRSVGIFKLTSPPPPPPNRRRKNCHSFSTETRFLFCDLDRAPAQEKRPPFGPRGYPQPPSVSVPAEHSY